ncbi:MAG: molybdopterin molybdenumtransferase MoeA [Chitinophagaceae bacterium BSSC1]|nr:MAG: molybdopterin molybdenumtransferase MoeA [Chitinophagaceae bacterium BSSC1]
MISVAEARNRIQAHSQPLDPIILPIEQAVGHVLVDDLLSQIDIPSFRQSSMDGYAIRWEERNESLRVQDELPAGSFQQLQLDPGATIKVFTGGPIPEFADTVVQKEWVALDDDMIRIQTEKLEIGMHIRMPGSEIAQQTLALPAGTLITASMVGFIASMGFGAIKVYRKPSMAIVITGNELVAPGNPLLPGQVYESNSYALTALLKEQGVERVSVFYAKDHLEETAFRLEEALSNHDMVLLTGGVSVGDYDFVVQACQQVGVEQVFHRVAQKPGKPIFFGVLEEKLVFGLPGNPASVMSCFRQYVLPAIQMMSGKSLDEPVMGKLKHSYEKQSNLCFFLKGRVENGIVSILGGQASYQQNSFVKANCWIELDAHQQRFEQFSMVKLHPFH